MTEGLSRLRLYKIYHGMLQRCTNPNNSNYQYYGGKGIAVCDEWSNKENGLQSFMEWSLSHGYNESLTIDRIDSSAGYAPDNCQWITARENAFRAHTVQIEDSVMMLAKEPRLMDLSASEKIRILLKRRGLTIGELAEKIGQSRQNLSNKMNRDNFTENELRSIAAALGCSYSAAFVMNDTGETL